MASWQQIILAAAVSAAAALAASCSGGTAGSEHSGATAASAVSSSQTPQAAPQGSTLLGRVLDENGAPLSGCLKTGLICQHAFNYHEALAANSAILRCSSRKASARWLISFLRSAANSAAVQPYCGR